MHTLDGSFVPKHGAIGGRCIMFPDALRIHDLVAKTAHVSLKNTLRVLLALRAVARSGDLTADEILDRPYQASRPSSEAAQHCKEAYLWLYDDQEVTKTLFEIEQLR